MSNRIAVVIPYFQRKPGILSKAINSALAQRDAPPFELIVVDDASPIPAREELAALMAAVPGRIRIIEQANGGPAAARNRGLEHVSPGTELVAFLDSDDEWTPDHLANAVAALGQDKDFYFANFYQLHQTVSAFERGGRIDPAQHHAIGQHGHLYQYAGDMFNQILTGNIIGTSTVVYRYARFAGQRFREEFVNAGEDYLFWLDLAQQTDKICFSTACETTYGEGVNVFAGSGWGTEHALIRIHYEIKYKKAIANLYPLTDTQRDHGASAIRTLRRGFIAELLHRISHRKTIRKDVLLRQWRTDPLTFVLALPLAISIRFGR